MVREGAMNDRIQAVLASLTAAERPRAEAIRNCALESLEHLAAVADEVGKIVQVVDRPHGFMAVLADMALGDITTAVDDLRDLLGSNPLAMKAREKC